MKKILFVGAEVMPFAATGGLGDVLGSLPAALTATSEEPTDIRVVLPFYEAVKPEWRAKMTLEREITVPLAWRQQYCGIYSLTKDGVIYYFLDNEYYFKRPTLYGYGDDGERYAFFCMAVCHLMKELDFIPDVLHCHDWQAALAVVYAKCSFAGDPSFAGIRTVFTIHNIAYQGNFDPYVLGDVFALPCELLPLMTYDGQLNLMKAAIECADIVSTVSPRYAEEILTPEHSHGLHHILERNRSKLLGILNGIDYQYYNPSADPELKVNYTADTLDTGKAANKRALQEELGLPLRDDLPLVAIISRLASHKGLDLVCDSIRPFLEQSRIQLVLLGTGEAAFEDFFRGLQEQFPDLVRAEIRYNRDLSKRIYAASDLFLMPSRSEPCGLSQMIASRYGSIPIVRETGGLYDSIKGYWEKDGELMGNGFTFANPYPGELADRLNAAISLWNKTELRQRFVQKVYAVDFSWAASAKDYLAMYRTLYSAT